MSAVFFLAAFALLRPGDAQLALIIAGATVMTGTVGPAAAAVVDVVAPALRATAASVLALTQNLLGLAAGPLITGFLSDTRGLPYAMAFVPVFSVLAAVVFTLAARSYVTDRSNAASGPLAFAGLSRRTQG
jgi:hypothetical protein